MNGLLGLAILAPILMIIGGLLLQSEPLFGMGVVLIVLILGPVFLRLTFAYLHRTAFRGSWGVLLLLLALTVQGVYMMIVGKPSVAAGAANTVIWGIIAGIYWRAKSEQWK